MIQEQNGEDINSIHNALENVLFYAQCFCPWQYYIIGLTFQNGYFSTLPPSTAKFDKLQTHGNVSKTFCEKKKKNQNVIVPQYLSSDTSQVLILDRNSKLYQENFS